MSVDLHLVRFVLFAVGVVTFILEVVQPIGLIPNGGIMQTGDALFLVLRFRKNCMFWASKGHIT